MTAGTLAVALALPYAAQAAADRNHDHLPDRWERAHHLSLKVNQAPRDQDHDGIVNRFEYRFHTDPRRKDSDGDGVPDGHEDANHDGVTNAVEEAVTQETHPEGDGPASPPQHVEPIGVVASFADGILHVAGPDNADIKGSVDGATRLMCAPLGGGVAIACSTDRLLSGMRVIVGRRTSDHWDVLVLLPPGAEGTPVVTPPTTPPLAPPPPPVVPAPAATGTITAVGDGSVTITRPSGEVVAGAVNWRTVLRCVQVADGHVVSNEPCSAAHLVVGGTVALATRTLIDGVWTWTAITAIEQ